MWDKIGSVFSLIFRLSTDYPKLTTVALMAAAFYAGKWFG